MPDMSISCRALSRSHDVKRHTARGGLPLCNLFIITMAASITIAHANGRANLPVRVPHLMPFHIQHTGPAPVSTYFRIQPHVAS
jgi:hypothetical protein